MWLMFSRMPVNIWRGRVTCSGPAKNSVTMTSSNDVAKANRAPATTPGAMMGKVIEKKVRSGEAPRLWLALTRSEEHTSELQALMRISSAVYCLKKYKKKNI